jgi:hypothetical protein
MIKVVLHPLCLGQEHYSIGGISPRRPPPCKLPSVALYKFVGWILLSNYYWVVGTIEIELLNDAVFINFSLIPHTINSS